MLPFRAALSGLLVTRCLLFVAAALSAAVATAAESWLTIVGEPGYSCSHYIQVNPDQIGIKGHSHCSSPRQPCDDLDH